MRSTSDSGTSASSAVSSSGVTRKSSAPRRMSVATAAPRRGRTASGARSMHKRSEAPCAMLVTRRMKRTRLSCAASSSAEAASGGGAAPSASALPWSRMAADQKRHLGSSRTPSPTLPHDVVMALVPHLRSTSIWASRHAMKALTKVELKSMRVMVGSWLPGAERQARNTAPM